MKNLGKVLAIAVVLFLAPEFLSAQDVSLEKALISNYVITQDVNPEEKTSCLLLSSPIKLNEAKLLVDIDDGGVPKSYSFEQVDESNYKLSQKFLNAEHSFVVALTFTVDGVDRVITKFYKITKIGSEDFSATMVAGYGTEDSFSYSRFHEEVVKLSTGAVSGAATNGSTQSSSDVRGTSNALSRALSSIGRRVGSGDCYAFVSGITGGNIGPVVGNGINVVRPGAILHMRGFSYNSDQGRSSGSNHYAIVESVDGNGNATIIHQNTSGRKYGVRSFMNLHSYRGGLTVHMPN